MIQGIYELETYIETLVLLLQPQTDIYAHIHKIIMNVTTPVPTNTNCIVATQIVNRYW